MENSSSQLHHPAPTHGNVRVIKPNRAPAPQQHNGSSNSSLDFDHRPSQSALRFGGGQRPFQANHQNLSQDSSSATAPMPAVKILAKQSNRPISTSQTTTILASQPLKTPTIVANRSHSGIVARSTNSSNNVTDTVNHNRTVSKQAAASSFQILEKQLARMHIIPSAEQKLKEQSPNCTKLLDGEFKMQETATMERLLLQDPQSTGQASAGGSSPGNTGQSFCIVGAVGLDGVGKSSVLNSIANKQVFKTHCQFTEAVKDGKLSSSKPRDNPLTHVTNGVDLHITPERLFLLDTQPLLSASILDEFLRNNTMSGASMSAYHHHHPNHLANGTTTGSSLSSVVGFDITEPENFALIYSMQLLTFMFAICDHLIIVLDSFSLDIYLLKLVATALMMVGDSVPKANLIIYLKPRSDSSSSVKPNTSFVAQTNASPAAVGALSATEDCKSENCESDQQFAFSPPRSASHNRMFELLKSTVMAILGPNVSVDFVTDERRLMTTVLKPPPRNLLITVDQQARPIAYTTERAWLSSVQRFWDNSIRKSSLFVDYARYLP